MIFFLIGFMGCGKTTLGRKAAQENGYVFLDLDEYIEQKYEKTISEIFACWGEEKFREIERESLHFIIKKYETLQNEIIIFSCGGGTPCFFDNHVQMKMVGKSIYVQEKVEVLAQRLQEARFSRPLLQSLTEMEMMDFVIRLLAEREETYLQADCILHSPSTHSLSNYIIQQTK